MVAIQAELFPEAANQVDISALGPYVQPLPSSGWGGEKFPGGLQHPDLDLFNEIWTDYYTLRRHSSKLFRENLYARGLIRRLVTNEVNSGLTPEVFPDEQAIGVPEDSLAEWTETTERRFLLWSRNKRVCDWSGEQTFGALQRAARMEAIIGGDCLVVLHQSPAYRLPQIELIPGDKIVSPLTSEYEIPKTNYIEHGIELDSRGRHVAYWVRQPDGLNVRRVPAWGDRSRRRLAWMIYGTERRHGSVRGEPLLGLVVQSLKELDRYRDSATRKAVINSILAMFIKKTADRPSSLPISNGAIRRDTVKTLDNTPPPTEARNFNIAHQVPGVVMEELGMGEEPVGFHSQGTDINFPVFESAIINAIAWANEVPPEILTLSFNSNYSASQAAINEFKAYLAVVWAKWGEDFCQPIYEDWLLSETLNGTIRAPGLLESWRNPAQATRYTAWNLAEWYGLVKPSTDMVKTAKASSLLVSEGWSTNAKEARNISGTKFSNNAKRLRRENELKAEALRPLLQLRQEFGLGASSMADVLSAFNAPNFTAGGTHGTAEDSGNRDLDPDWDGESAFFGYPHGPGRDHVQHVRG